MLKVLMSCQKILDPRNTQTFEGEKNKKKVKDFIKVKRRGVHWKCCPILAFQKEHFQSY